LRFYNNIHAAINLYQQDYNTLFIPLFFCWLRLKTGLRDDIFYRLPINRDEGLIPGQEMTKQYIKFAPNLPHK
jgi:hypothetical protein